MFYPDCKIIVKGEEKEEEITIYDLFWKYKIPMRRIFKGYYKDFSELDIEIKGRDESCKIKFMFFQRLRTKIIEIAVEDLTLYATENTEVLLESGEWKKLKDIHSGEKIYTIYGFKEIKSKKISFSAGEIYFYGIETVDKKPFFCNGILVSSDILPVIQK